MPTRSRGPARADGFLCVSSGTRRWCGSRCMTGAAVGRSGDSRRTASRAAGDCCWFLSLRTTGVWRRGRVPASVCGPSLRTARVRGLIVRDSGLAGAGSRTVPGPGRRGSCGPRGVVWWFGRTSRSGRGPRPCSRRRRRRWWRGARSASGTHLSSPARPGRPWSGRVRALMRSASTLRVPELAFQRCVVVASAGVPGGVPGGGSSAGPVPEGPDRAAVRGRRPGAR